MGARRQKKQVSHHKQLRFGFSEKSAEKENQVSRDPRFCTSIGSVSRAEMQRNTHAEMPGTCLLDRRAACSSYDFIRAYFSLFPVPARRKTEFSSFSFPCLSGHKP